MKGGKGGWKPAGGGWKPAGGGWKPPAWKPGGPRWKPARWRGPGASGGFSCFGCGIAIVALGMAGALIVILMMVGTFAAR